MWSTNEHVGRQIWVFDEKAGSNEDRAEVERLREKFAKHRSSQKHSSDELLRLQQWRKAKVRACCV